MAIPKHAVRVAGFLLSGNLAVSSAAVYFTEPGHPLASAVIAVGSGVVAVKLFKKIRRGNETVNVDSSDIERLIRGAEDFLDGQNSS